MTTPFTIGPVGSPTTRQVTPFSLNPSGMELEGVEVPERVVQSEADRMDYALGEVSPGARRIADNLRLNGESLLRDMAAARTADLAYEERIAATQAAAEAGNIEGTAALINTPMPPPAPPNVAVETLWARMFVNDYFFEDGEYPDYQMLSPQEKIQYDVMVHSLEENLIRDEVILRKYEEYSQQWAETNFLDQAWDVVETMIPGVSWMTFANELNAIPAYNDLHLTGDNLRAQIEYLHALPAAEFERVFSEAVDSIARTNVNLAFYFIQAVQSYSTSEQALDNLFDIIDIAGVATGTVVTGLARSAFRAVRGTSRTPIPRVQTTGTRPPTTVAETFQTGSGQLQPTIWSTSSTMRRQALRDVREAAENTIRNLNDARIAHVVGNETDEIFTVVRDPQAAARNEVWTAGQADAGRIVATPEEIARRIAIRIPAYANPTQISTGNRFFAFTRDAIARIETSFTKLDPTGAPIARSTYHISRMTREEAEEAFQKAEARTRNELSRHGDNLIYDVERIQAENTPHNVDLVRVRMAKPNGDLFVNQSEAHRWARSVMHLDKGSYEVLREGTDWALAVTKPADETQSVLDMAIATNNQTRQPWFGMARSASDILGRSIRSARKSVEHRQQFNNKEFEAIQRDRVLPTAQRKEMEQFLIYLRNTGNYPGVDPTTAARTLTSQADFEAAWLSRFGKMPSKKQSRAYWATVRLEQRAWAIGNMATYRALERQGVLEIQLVVDGKGSKIPFKGRILDDFNFDELPQDATVMFYSRKAMSGPGSIYSDVKQIRDFNSTDRAAFSALLKNGNVQAIRVENRSAKPFQTLGESDVEYVLTGDFVSKRLSTEQIPWNPGPKIINNEPVELRQVRTGHFGRFGRKGNFGETVVSTAHSQKLGREMARDFNTALDLYKKLTTGPGPANMHPLIAHLNSTLPHVDAMEFIDALRTGALSTNGKIYHVTRGTDVVTTYKGKDVDLDAQLAGTVDMEDDLPIGSPIGTGERPMWDLDIPEFLSPRAALDRQMQTATRLTHIADYVTKSAYHFVREFEKVLDAKRADLRANPIKFLLKPKWKTGSGLVEHNDLLRKAKNFHRATRDLLSNRGPIRRGMAYLEDKLFESIYGHTMGQIDIGGKSVARHAADLMGWLIDSPPAILRRYAFEMKMGLFQYTQVFKQMATMLVSAGITGNPLRAMKAAGGAFLQMPLVLASKSPSMVNHMAGLAAKIGWSRSDFLEVWKLADESGLTLVRGEHAFKDQFLDPGVITNRIGHRFGQFLNFGSMFFKNGEVVSRLNGLNIAYLEWRKANPHKKLMRHDAEDILDRSDDLTVNMTHASNASWQKGWTAFPTQFFSYQIRLMELVWGKRLTPKERTRLILTQSIIFGLPIGGFGTALGVFGPVHDRIQKELIAAGIDLDNTAVQLWVNGAIGALTQLATGEATTAAEDYGAGGMELFVNALTGDETFMEIVLGITGSTLAQTIDAAYPFMVRLKGMLGLGPDGPNPTWEDFQELFRVSSGFTQIERAYYALNAMAYLRRDGREAFINMDGAQVALEAIFGIDPNEINEEFLMQQIGAEHTQMQRRPREEISEAFRRMYDQAIREDIPLDEKRRLIESIELEIAQWVAIGGFIPEQLNQIAADALRERSAGPTFFRIWEQFSTNQNLPNRDERLQQFIDDPQRQNQLDIPNTPVNPQVIQNIQNIGNPR